MGKVLKIASLIFGSLRVIGGYQIFTYNLLAHLHRRGHQVDLYIPWREYTRNRSFYQNLAFQVEPLFYRTDKLFKYAPAVLKCYLWYRQIKRNYDVWQIIGAYPAAYVARTLFGKVPLVLRTHGDDIQKDAELNYGLRLNPVLEARIQDALHRMDRLVSLTESVSVCYKELGVPEERIVEIPNGVDLVRFSDPVDRDELRREWNLPLNRPLILTVGRYHAKKEYKVIPHIARILKKSGIVFHWLVVGKDTDKLNDLIVAQEVDDCVHTIEEIGPGAESSPAVSFSLPSIRMISLYRCADIFVFPSRMETFGRVIIEAMAAGLPVVTTDAPGCRDVVSHGSTGLLVQPGSIDGFVQQIKKLFQDSTLRQRLVENGFQHAKLYDWERVVEQYENLYRSLIPVEPMS